MALPAFLRFEGFRDKRLHLGVSGSISAYKSLDLLRKFLSTGCSAGVTLTQSARQFVTPLSFQALGADPVHCDMYPVEPGAQGIYAHLHPGREADALVVAPATAQTLAKAALGIADDMLGSQMLSFPRPIVFAPAMNPNLWHASATQANVAKLIERGHVFVGPESGDVACGDTGIGRLASLESIYLAGLRSLSPQNMENLRVLLTIGPTREHWDAVRFWSNPSSGTMGASLAIAAWLRGARVTAICGPGVPQLPDDILRLDITSANELYEACNDTWPQQDVGCFTAAVADFRPSESSAQKRKKTAIKGDLSIPFSANFDVLAAMSASKKDKQKIIGFAAETSDLEIHARDKLERKGLDMIVANRIDEPGAGFTTSTNKVLVLDRLGRIEQWPLMPKPEIAWRVWDWLLLAFS